MGSVKGKNLMFPKASPRGEEYYPGMLKVSPNSGFSQFKKPQNLNEEKNSGESCSQETPLLN
jgi:hypothetical protein